MKILGVDPGLEGGLAVLDCQPRRRPELISVLDVPTIGEDAKRRVWAMPLLEWLYERRPDVAYIERAQAMPDQGATSGFIYGRAVGALEMAVLASGIKLKTAEPQTWKREIGIARVKKANGDTDVPATKRLSLELAADAIAAAAEHLMYASNHNRAEAMLIAVFGAWREGIPVLMPAPPGRLAV